MQTAPCSVLDARMPGAAIEISGIAVHGAEWDALAAALDTSFGARSGLPPARFDVELLASDACRAVEALAPAIRRARAGDVPRLIALPQHELTAGQRMTVTLRVPAGAHVTADLFRLPDAVEHLATTGSGDRLLIGLPATAPAGPRVLSVIVSSAAPDLPAGATGADATSYLTALSGWVRTSQDAVADLASFELRPIPAHPAQPRPAPQAVVGAPRPASHTVRPGRCSAILERAQLGESLSDADRAALRGECAG